MRRLALVLLLLPFALTADTAQTFQVHDHVSLEVGLVPVWLGMTQEEAAKRFRDAGYKVTVAGNQLRLKSGTRKFRDAGYEPTWTGDQFLLKSGDSHVLWFKAGQLAFADREWITSDKPDKLDAVIGALGELAEEAKNESCNVVHSSDPSLLWMWSNQVFVSCGQRSVLIDKGAIFGQAFETVSERIGEVPTKEE